MKIDIFEVINKYIQKAPVNIQYIIEDLNITLEFNDLGAQLSGAIEKKKDDNYLITINERDPYTRQRFTMAHELGHYIYHKDKIGDGIQDDRMYRGIYLGKGYNKEIGKKEETQANQFAANLLMPWPLIKKLRKEGLEIDEIASKLEVSIKALNIRIEDHDN